MIWFSVFQRLIALNGYSLLQWVTRDWCEGLASEGHCEVKFNMLHQAAAVWWTRITNYQASKTEFHQLCQRKPL